MARPGYIVCLCPDGACSVRVQRLMRQAMERERDAREARRAQASDSQTFEELCEHYRQIAEQVQLEWLRHGVCPSSPKRRKKAR